jgi:DNA-binding HxlR family transcriptional regulator
VRLVAGSLRFPINGSSSGGSNPDVQGALELLGQRHVLTILVKLREGECGFNELKRGLGISPSTLRDRLRSLEDHDIVTRRVQPRPYKVLYGLTETGRNLAGITNGVKAWESEWEKTRHRGKKPEEKE